MKTADGYQILDAFNKALTQNSIPWFLEFGCLLPTKELVLEYLHTLIPPEKPVCTFYEKEVGNSCQPLLVRELLCGPMM